MTRRRRVAQHGSLEQFFRYCYERSLQLDDPRLKNDDDLPRALIGIRAAARVGYFDLTGEWLSPTKAVR